MKGEFVMFSSVNEYESLVATILNCLKYSTPLKSIYEEHGSQKVNEALYYCSKEELIIGITPMRAESNDVLIDFTSLPRITVKGLKYIESYNGESTSQIAHNADKRAREADKRSKVAIWISALALVSNVLLKLLGF